MPAAGVEATVEPVVLFSIVDHYSRRDEGQDFVIGTLLGNEENGVVSICSSLRGFDRSSGFHTAYCRSLIREKPVVKSWLVSLVKMTRAAFEPS